MGIVGSSWRRLGMAARDRSSICTIHVELVSWCDRVSSTGRLCHELERGEKIKGLRRNECRFESCSLHLYIPSAVFT